MESEKQQLYGDKQAVEQEKVGLREELVRVEQEKLDIDSEKSGIIQTLELSEQTRERLEDEIMALNKDRAELTEQLNAVSQYWLQSKLQFFWKLPFWWRVVRRNM